MNVDEIRQKFIEGSLSRDEALRECISFLERVQIEILDLLTLLKLVCSYRR